MLPKTDNAGDMNIMQNDSTINNHRVQNVHFPSPQCSLHIPLNKCTWGAKGYKDDSAFWHCIISFIINMIPTLFCKFHPVPVLLLRCYGGWEASTWFSLEVGEGLVSCTCFGSLLEILEIVIVCFGPLNQEHLSEQQWKLWWIANGAI